MLCITSSLTSYFVLCYKLSVLLFRVGSFLNFVSNQHLNPFEKTEGMYSKWPQSAPKYSPMTRPHHWLLGVLKFKTLLTGVLNKPHKNAWIEQIPAYSTFSIIPSFPSTLTSDCLDIGLMQKVKVRWWGLHRKECVYSKSVTERNELWRIRNFCPIPAFRILHILVLFKAS